MFVSIEDFSVKFGSITKHLVTLRSLIQKIFKKTLFIL